ncbi:hypothetical protein ACEQ8H_008849 [Pleosporales sp. CAS-2024a]
MSSLTPRRQDVNLNFHSFTSSHPSQQRTALRTLAPFRVSYRCIHVLFQQSKPMGNACRFDFNDAEQPNPWHGAQSWQAGAPRPETVYLVKSESDTAVQVRRFARCYDDDLRAYLALRSISLGFLEEIDQFLGGHPEIATCAEGRNMLRLLTELPPLQAYKYFLKGYTRPARYMDGVIPDAFNLPTDFTYQSLSTKRDPELVEFFHGFDYRHDIIERIDSEVYMGMQELINGRHIPLALRKLICYSIWGNPVDAYKWYATSFEYSYQSDYMPHKYLPEHIVLSHVPKPLDYSEPRPSVPSSSRKHGNVRARMAHANDQGVDVLEVLIAEYRLTLVRRGYRRLEIDDLVVAAKRRLDKERQDPTGIDIVDLIIDDAVARQGTKRGRVQRGKISRNYKAYHLGAHGVCYNDYRGHSRVHLFTPIATAERRRRAPGFLLAQTAELGSAKTALARLYSQEEHAVLYYNSQGSKAGDSGLGVVRASRASAERRYVNCLIRYCRKANRMSALEAGRLQRHFTRKKMSDLKVSHKDYLLSMYPRELD